MGVIYHPYVPHMEYEYIHPNIPSRAQQREYGDMYVLHTVHTCSQYVPHAPYILDILGIPGYHPKYHDITPYGYILGACVRTCTYHLHIPPTSLYAVYMGVCRYT